MAGAGRRWRALPLVAAGCDLLENVCQLSLILGWTTSEAVFYTGALAAWLKWGAVVGALGRVAWRTTKLAPAPN
jgi:hypothetical protein